MGLGSHISDGHRPSCGGMQADRKAVTGDLKIANNTLLQLATLCVPMWVMFFPHCKAVKRSEISFVFHCLFFFACALLAREVLSFFEKGHGHIRCWAAVDMLLIVTVHTV